VREERREGERVNKKTVYSVINVDMCVRERKEERGERGRRAEREREEREGLN